VANPNCVVTGLALALAPIERAFGLEASTVVTLQALSGAGSGGPAALAAAANVLPFIAGEEEKIPGELQKVLGAGVDVAVAVTRVPVVDGHTAHVFLRLGRCAPPTEVVEVLEAFRPEDDIASLPSIPRRPLVVRSETDRPQPRLDAGAGGGMTVSVGRIREAPPYDVALTLVVHNTVRGAAGACVANAELCLARGLVAGGQPAAT
jgi:aspartate-semialdehyde dehydrogenase